MVLKSAAICDASRLSSFSAGAPSDRDVTGAAPGEGGAGAGDSALASTTVPPLSARAAGEAEAPGELPAMEPRPPARRVADSIMAMIKASLSVRAISFLPL